MEKLIEMIKVANKKALRRIEVLHPQQSRGSKLYQLYTGIHDEHFKTDDEAAQAIYHADASDVRYQKLKNRLSDRLMTTLLYVDGPKTTFSDLDQQRIKCRRNLMICQILLTGYARKAALNIGRRGLLLAERYELSDLAYSFCRILIGIYSLRGAKKQVQDLIIRKAHHRKMMIKTDKAQEYYASFGVNFIHSQGKSPELSQLLDTYCEELEAELDEPGTFDFFFNAYLLLGFRYEMALDYENLCKFSEKAIKYFMTKPKIARQAIYQFNLKILVSSIHLQLFDKGEAAAAIAYEHTIKERANWYLVAELHIMLRLHAENFQAAYLLWLDITQLKSFQKSTEARAENWLLLQAFLYFLLTVGKIQSPTANAQTKKFRLARFLNEVPKFAMDKRGFNIPILILQILFYLQHKKYGEISDRVETLNAYCYRYLRKNDTYRSNCFIKMLMVLPKAQFHREAVIRQSKKYHQRLLESNNIRNTKSAEIEIIPYETLWKLVLEMLDNRFH